MSRSQRPPMVTPSLPFNTLIGLTGTKDFRRILSSAARNSAGPVMPVILFSNPRARARARARAVISHPRYDVPATFRTRRNIRVAESAVRVSSNTSTFSGRYREDATGYDVQDRLQLWPSKETMDNFFFLSRSSVESVHSA